MTAKQRQILAQRLAGTVGPGCYTCRMLYTAHATAEAPHREHRGVEVHALADTGHGWADRGVVQRSRVMEWRRFDPQVADMALARMGWARTGTWETGGGVWFATVVRARV